jgi:hypothetical protein
MNTTTAEQLAQALGIPFFRTPYFLPDYPEGEWGAWRISRMGTGLDRGYYTRQWVISGMPVLLRRNPGNQALWETWMSLTPHEIESQEPGCLCATGYTVVMGLGMGWIAINAALNPSVRRITVVELDRDVISLFSEAEILKQVPPEIRDKIRLVHADAREWRPEEPVDFLFADIWRTLADADTLEDVRRMQRNVRAMQIYFWGQELRLYNAFRRLFGPEATLGIKGIGECAVREIGLPLALPWGDGYIGRIEAAIRNRLERRLPLQE